MINRIVRRTIMTFWDKRSGWSLVLYFPARADIWDSVSKFCRMSDMIIIGLTGSFGSGCTYIRENVLARLGYKEISLSEILREKWHEANPGKNLKDFKVERIRPELQKFGDTLREKEGPKYLAQCAKEKMEGDTIQTKWVVDSIRNPNEIRELRDYSNRFFLFGVSAEKKVRWERVREKFSGNENQFDECDQIDSGKDSLQTGQRVADCFYEADIVFANNTNFATPGNAGFQRLDGSIKEYINLIEDPLTSAQPRKKHEPMMAMAYAISQRSSCSQRKVGAVIADQFSSIVASGFNEVPRDERSCAAEYSKCYRKHLTDKFFSDMSTKFPEVEAKIDDIRSFFKASFKNLDDCRALHAEENAILSLARHATNVNLKECTLYTTTYPCKLCANKIAETGIGKVIYLEPYPQPAAKEILKGAGIQDEFFEGVTFRSFFRLYGEQK